MEPSHDNGGEDRYNDMLDKATTSDEEGKKVYLNLSP
jgi:hypothetical protein